MSRPSTSAPGITSIDTLLSTFVPVLSPVTYAYLNAPDKSTIVQELTESALFCMHEAPPPSEDDPSPRLSTTTLILPLEVAQRHVDNEEESIKIWPCEMVTLEIQSSLEAVGFLARIAAALTAEGIAANCVSGFWRDYLFVGVSIGDAVVEVLNSVASEARSTQATLAVD